MTSPLGTAWSSITARVSAAMRDKCLGPSHPSVSSWRRRRPCRAPASVDVTESAHAPRSVHYGHPDLRHRAPIGLSLKTAVVALPPTALQDGRPQLLGRGMSGRTRCLVSREQARTQTPRPRSAGAGCSSPQKCSDTPAMKRSCRARQECASTARGRDRTVRRARPVRSALEELEDLSRRQQRPCSPEPVTSGTRRSSGMKLDENAAATSRLAG